jgi:uncharacterized protein (DUF362 family)
VSPDRPVPDPGIAATTLPRREFLSRAVKAGAAVGAVGALAAWLYDPEGPDGRPRSQRLVLPDWRVPLDGPQVAVVTGRERVEAVGRALAMLGGIERFVRPGDRVLVKPNVAFASPPSLGATAHPDTVGEIVRLCLAAGAASVVVTDNPIADPRGAFEISGVARAVERAGGRLLIPAPADFQAVTVPGTRHLIDWPVLAAPLLAATRVIGVAPVKCHHRAGASLGLKNWYGLLGGARSVFHQDEHGLVRDLALAVRPTLTVLDGTDAMMTNGPTGGSLSDLKPTRTLIAGTDPVAVDVLGLALLDRTAADAPYVRLAAEAGAGSLDPDAVRVLVDRRG